MIDDAFGLLEKIAHDQGASLDAALETDSAQHLRAVVRVSQLPLFLQAAADTAEEVSVLLRISTADESGSLIRTPQGRWRLDSGDGKVAPMFPGYESRDEWSSDDVREALHSRGLDMVAELDVDKSPWREAVESRSGRSSWIGYSEASFRAWLETRSSLQVAQELFRLTAGAVVIYRWNDDVQHFGERLLIVPLKAISRLGPPPDDVVWPHEAPIEVVRAAQIEPPSDDVGPYGSLLLRVAAVSAARIIELASTSDGRGDAGDLAIRWQVVDEGGVELDDVEGGLALIRWVATEPTTLRLAIACRVAAQRLPDPLHGPPSDALISVANIAYESAIDDSVREALLQQAELERSFREMDSSLASAREAMTQGFESSLTRALAAVVAIGIAAVTADNFSGPLLIASAGLITAYLVIQATFGLAAHKRDLLSRLGTFELLVRGRGNRLSESLAIEIHTWKKQVGKRVRWLRFILVLVVIAIVVGGIAGASFIEARKDSDRGEEGRSDRRRN